MILRFKSISSQPEHLGINTELRTYTRNREEVCKGFVISVACNHFEHILRELDFNSFDYSDDLHTAPQPEPVPF